MNILKKYFGVIAWVLAGVFGLFSCTDELISDNPDYKLSFSTDTLTFDTVFSTFGSTTEKILIYNKNKKPLKISTIALSGGISSQFRLNVDGLRNPENRFADVEIAAKDSIYLFVEVTIDAQNSDLPVLVSDSILFSVNGNLQKIQLEAYGQDVVLWKSKLIKNDTTLTADRPYLVYDYLAIDSAKTLTLPAGCKIYFHNNAQLIVYGNLIADGSLEKPVEMCGDRLDKIKYYDPVPYSAVAGQWDGVYLLWSKGKHKLNHLRLSSGNVGIYSPNTDRNNLPEIEISNSVIHNFMFYGVVVQNTNLKIYNSEISNTGSYTLYLNGGTHEILQSTIVNFYNYSAGAHSSRDKYPAVMLMGLNRPAKMKTTFRNTVISGNLDTELSMASRFINLMDVNFDNNLIRRKTPYDFVQFTNNLWQEPKDTLLFKSRRYTLSPNRYFDFTPDSLSVLRDKADWDVANQFPYDLKGNSRLADGKPDIGAYEWVATY